MKKLISTFKKLRLHRVFTVLLASAFLFVTTACGTNAAGLQSSMPGESNQGIPGHRSQSYQGGMNGYSNVDSRRVNTGDAVTKAKGLRDNAERNVIDLSDDLSTNTKRTLDKKGENLEHFGDNLRDSSRATARKTERTADQLGRAADRGTDNLKRAGREFSNEAPEIVEDATSGLKKRADRAGDAVAGTAQKTAEGISKTAQNKANDAARSTQRALENAGDSLSNNRG